MRHLHLTLFLLSLSPTSNFQFLTSFLSSSLILPSADEAPMLVPAVERYGTELAQLLEMGYEDSELNLEALVAQGGDIFRAISHIEAATRRARPQQQPLRPPSQPQQPVYQPPPRPPHSSLPPLSSRLGIDPAERYKDQLASLRALGMPQDEPTMLAALARANGNLDHAVALLFGD